MQIWSDWLSTPFLIQNVSFGIGKTIENVPVHRETSYLRHLLCQTYTHMKFISWSVSSCEILSARNKWTYKQHYCARRKRSPCYVALETRRKEVERSAISQSLLAISRRCRGAKSNETGCHFRFVEFRHNNKTFQNIVKRIFEILWQNQTHSEKVHTNYINDVFLMMLFPSTKWSLSFSQRNSLF